MAKTKSTRRIKCRNSFERTILNELDTMKVYYQYEPFRIPYQKPVSHYLPDIVLDNGTIIEIKGIFDAQDRKKHLLLKEQHPNLNVHFVFQQSNKKITKSSKTTYAAWCEKHGFPYAEKHLPKEWKYK